MTRRVLLRAEDRSFEHNVQLADYLGGIEHHEPFRSHEQVMCTCVAHGCLDVIYEMTAHGGIIARLHETVT